MQLENFVVEFILLITLWIGDRLENLRGSGQDRTNDHIENRDDEEVEEGGDDHPAEYGGTHRVSCRQNPRRWQTPAEGRRE